MTKSVRVFGKQILKKDGSSFIGYTCHDREGKFYNVHFARKCISTPKEGSWDITFDEAKAFITPNAIAGYNDVLVINDEDVVCKKCPFENKDNGLSKF